MGSNGRLAAAVWPTADSRLRSSGTSQAETFTTMDITKRSGKSAAVKSC